MFTSITAFEGRLAEDPNVMENMTELVILTNRRKPNDDGEWENTDTSRFTVKCFKTLATKTGEKLHTGDKVVVIGSIVTDTWVDSGSGDNRYKQVVLADVVAQSL